MSGAQTIEATTAIAEARAAVAAGRLVQLRTRARLSQNELARTLGVSSAAVSRWESGLRMPRSDVAERLGLVLHHLERLADLA